MDGSEIQAFLQTPTSLRRVLLVCFSDVDRQIYQDAYREIFAIPGARREEP